MRKSIIFILLLLVFTACLDEPDCVQEASNDLIIGFRNLDTGEDQEVFINSIRINNSDSSFYAGDEIDIFTAPLDPLENTARIIIDSNFGKDTLEFNYTTFTRLIAPDCGAETFIENIEITKHTTDSIGIVDPNILPGVTVNYEIYY